MLRQTDRKRKTTLKSTEMTTEFLIPIAFFAMVYGIVYLFIRKKERLALIAKGADASIFESSRQPSSLKWGLVFVGIGTGILLGKILAVYTTLQEEPAFFSMICLFGGFGLIIYHLIASKFEEPAKE
jgi:hypothetical protein